MATKKCVHKGCGKAYADADNAADACVFHPGPPEFHEGTKGWKCCKPRVLTFDDFLAIPPCTRGAHADVDDAPPVPRPDNAPPEHHALMCTKVPLPPVAAADAPVPRRPQATTAPPKPPPPDEPASEDDDPSVPVSPGQTCKRRGCQQQFAGGSRAGEQCVHHPGAPVFHEGTKGWSCCKPRVLDFDVFLGLAGCRTKAGHLFVGRAAPAGEELLDSVRTDFYQTATAVVASVYLKRIDHAASAVAFAPDCVRLDLRTADNKRYKTDLDLFAAIDPDASSFAVLGTKLDLTLAKADGASWPVLRADDKRVGEIIQVGSAGRA